MNTKNIIAVIAIIVLGGVLWFAKPFTTKAPENIPTSTSTPVLFTTDKTENTNTPIKPKVEIKQSPEEIKMAKNLQTILDSYLLALKNHDVEKTKDLSFQLSDYCANPDKYQKECFSAMDGLIKAFTDIKTKDFTTVWYDKMQAILMTEPRPATYEGNPGFYQPRIFFGVKDGVYKVLAVFPDWGRFASKDKVPANEIQTFLQKAMLDSDKDGLTDMEENCDNGGGPGSMEGCIKTDPLVRDENRNGWWDGVEIYIRPIKN